MVTIGGGLFCSETMAIPLAAEQLLPFLKVGEKKLTTFKSLHLLSASVCCSTERSPTKIVVLRSGTPLLKLGFKEKDLWLTRNLIRYLPRYVETIV